MLSNQSTPRAWTTEEETSLSHLRRVLSEDELADTGYAEFLGYYQSLPLRSFRLEAVHYSLIYLLRQGVNKSHVRGLLEGIPALFNLGLYDVQIEDYLDGARAFTREFPFLAPYEEFFNAYTSTAIRRDRLLSLSLTMFVRQLSSIVTTEIRRPAPTSLLIKSTRNLFLMIASAETEVHSRILWKLLNLSTDVSSLAIVSGKALRTRDIGAFRQFLKWTEDLILTEGFLASEPSIVDLHESVLRQLHQSEFLGFEILWQNSSIRS